VPNPPHPLEILPELPEFPGKGWILRGDTRAGVFRWLWEEELIVMREFELALSIEMLISYGFDVFATERLGVLI